MHYTALRKGEHNIKEIAADCIKVFARLTVFHALKVGTIFMFALK